MKEASLPSPGVGSKSMHLRRIAVNAISSLEITAPKYTGGAHPSAAGLKAFFDACSAAAATIGKSLVTLVFAGAGGSTAITGTGTNQTTLNKGGSTGTATYSSSNTAVATVNASGLVTGVAAGTAVITVNVAEDATHKAATASLTFTVS